MGRKLDSVPPSYGDIGAENMYKKHETLFFQNVHFMFDDILYKFPRYYLGESIIFEQLFGNKLSEKKTLELGISGNGTPITPFICLAVKKEMFESLIFLLSSTISIPKIESIKKEQWLGILELSCIWQMEKVIEMAISYLLKLEVDPIVKLELAKRYGIQHKAWSRSAIMGLVRRDQELTNAEAQHIGIEKALKLSKLRGVSRVSVLFSFDRRVNAYVQNAFPEFF
ncbi:hypothetical protein AX15_001853 [Amanita polypyramis BW_CC]|nr:hypothetical protein AX15_001853 [Amanita polypyramis BW_CC]